MGCISSKVITRSLSFQQEMKLSWQDRSTDGNDEFIAFVSTAKTILGNKHLLLTGSPPDLPSNTDTKPAIDPSIGTNKTIDTLELIAGLQEDKDEGKQEALSPPVVEKLEDIYKLVTRSRRFQCSPEHEMSGNVLPSRSFHTVEEYDAMVENIQLVQEQATGFGDRYGSTDLIDRKLKTQENVAHRDNELGDINLSEKAGLKRKAIAKGLKSLQIPSNVEFPSAVMCLREGGPQVYSPGAYVTPKFGSYNLPEAPTKSRKKWSEGDLVFDPELVAAFEECMQQLEVEEEIALKQIEQVLGESAPRICAADEEESCSSSSYV